MKARQSADGVDVRESVRVLADGESVTLRTIHRPGSTRTSTAFFNEFTSVLASLVLLSGIVIIGGDINIHMEDVTDADAQRLASLFDLRQHVDAPTHLLGGTLDLVATFSGCDVNDVSVDPAGVISDHRHITCRLPSHQPAADTRRSWVVQSRPTGATGGYQRKQLGTCDIAMSFGGQPIGRIRLCSSQLGLLDLSAAFDCVDHSILIKRLQQSFGICGNALAWIRSFLHGRCQHVAYNGQLLALMELLFGVRQGSVLGPLLFLLYTAELFDVIARSGLVGHSYAGDTQVYISAPATSAIGIDHCSALRFVRGAGRCLDEQQPVEDER